MGCGDLRLELLGGMGGKHGQGYLPKLSMVIVPATVAGLLPISHLWLCFANLFYFERVPESPTNNCADSSVKGEALRAVAARPEPVFYPQIGLIRPFFYRTGCSEPDPQPLTRVAKHGQEHLPMFSRHTAIILP